MTFIEVREREIGTRKGRKWEAKEKEVSAMAGN